MADRVTGEAKAEADGMLGEARTRSEELLTGARAKADGTVTEARTRAATLRKTPVAEPKPGTGSPGRRPRRWSSVQRVSTPRSLVR